MNLILINRLSHFYAFLTVLYPYDFRQEFASEMQAVFQEKLIATSKTGKRALWREFLERIAWIAHGYFDGILVCLSRYLWEGHHVSNYRR